ncbi:MAG: c-type cytochrome [Verrucomicrobiota bacterium]
MAEELSAFRQTCTGCHGDQAEGKPELGAPSIAGLPSWYIKEQIEKFRGNKRGYHPEDLHGQQMKAVALQISDEQLDAAAEEISKLSPITHPQADSAGAARGGELYREWCMNCHRYNGQGEQVFHSAPLVYLDRPYLTRQLANYRMGKRGGTEGDFYGAKMIEISATLTDQEIDDVISYLHSLAK